MSEAIAALKKSEKLYRKIATLFGAASIVIFAIGFLPFKFVWVSSEYLEDGNDVWAPTWSYWSDIEFANEDDCIAISTTITCQQRSIAITDVAPIEWISTAALIAAGVAVALWIMTKNAKLSAEAKN
jgi:hypothetical protein